MIFRRNSITIKLLMLMVLALVLMPLAAGCEAEEEPALDDAEGPEPPLEAPEEEPVIEEDPDYDDVEDPDPPVEDPALDELEENAED